MGLHQLGSTRVLEFHLYLLGLWICFHHAAYTLFLINCQQLMITNDVIDLGERGGWSLSYHYHTDWHSVIYNYHCDRRLVGTAAFGRPDGTHHWR